MKKAIQTTLSISLVLVISLFISSCRKNCTEFRTYTKFIPIEKTLEEIRKSFSLEEPHEMANPKKIYIYQDYLFIVDEFKGFQIIDNSDKSAPVPLKFVNLDGCTDVSVNNGIIYANQGPDIVSLSFNDISSISITNRLQNIMNTALTNGDKYVYDFERKEVTEEVDCGSDNTWSSRGNGFSTMEANFNTGNSNTLSNSSGGSTGANSGAGGSMARMSFVQGILYVVDEGNLTTISVDNGFTELYTGNIGSGVETIFGTEENLFIGTATGMLIYSRNNGYQPSYVGGISHARGCDPVVVQEDYAFVTVRGNGNCGEANNELLVVDISTINSPKLHSAHAMSSPYGLGVDGDNIMICDGTAGLRIFDKSDLNAITKNEIATISGIDAYDIIPLGSEFILSTSQGVFQYDFTDTKSPSLLSKIY